MQLGLSLSLTNTLSKGVPVLRYINSILSILLVDYDGSPAKDADGAIIYEAL